jgi:hypothetical protein
MRCSFLLLLGGALVLGCVDQQAPTAPSDQLTPSLRAERVPVLAPVFLGGDPSNPLAVQAGFEAGLIADDICPDNGEHVDPRAQGQGIFTPPGGFVASTSVHDMSLVVYQYGGGIVSNICQLVGAPVLGTGTANYTFELVFTGQGAFVIHQTLQGVIDLVSGGQARVNATVRVTILPDGTLLFDEERVRLTLL